MPMLLLDGIPFLEVPPNAAEIIGAFDDKRLLFDKITVDVELIQDWNYFTMKLMFQSRNLPPVSPNWINVEKKLPVTGVPVLILKEGSEYGIGILRKVQEGHFWENYEADANDHKYVQYWKELPLP